MTERYSSWSQGNILPEDALSKLQLDVERDNKLLFWIVISHDCDLANRNKEACVELIPAIKIDKPESAAGYGKNPRTLHIQYSLSPNENVWFELDARLKCAVNKNVLFEYQPVSGLILNGDGYTILQHWLASRYYRAAFPENFVSLIYRAVFTSKKDTLSSRIEKSLSQSGNNIRAILFDLDKGNLIERADTALYELGIYVLYDSSLVDAEEDAEKVAEKLTNDFEQAFQNNNDWKGICLEYCEPISDAVMTVAVQQNLKQWRLEYLSFSDEGVGTMLTAS